MWTSYSLDQVASGQSFSKATHAFCVCSYSAIIAALLPVCCVVNVAKSKGIQEISTSGEIDRLNWKFSKARSPQLSHKPANALFVPILETKIWLPG